MKVYKFDKKNNLKLLILKMFSIVLYIFISNFQSILDVF